LLEAKLNPAYAWGGAGLKPGAPGDCSGKLFAIFFRCGVPVTRVTAHMMGQGLGGWDFPTAFVQGGRPHWLVLMTLQSHRPQGHIGLLMSSVTFDGPAKMAHASGSMGFIIVDIGPANNRTLYKGIDFLMQTTSEGGSQ